MSDASKIVRNGEAWHVNAGVVRRLLEDREAMAGVLREALCFVHSEGQTVGALTLAIRIRDVLTKVQP